LDFGADLCRQEPKGYQTPLHLCAMNGFGQTAKANSCTDKNYFTTLNLNQFLF